MHTFAGHINPTKDQKPEDLRADGVESTNCNGPDLGEFEQFDLSSYWVPAVYSDNLTPSPCSPACWVTPEVILTYYRNAEIDPNSMRPFPQEFSMRAGIPMSEEVQSSEILDWSCVADKDFETPGHPNEVNFGQVMPDHCPKFLDQQTGAGHPNPDSAFYLRLVVYFPDCVNFDSADTPNGQWVPQDFHYGVTAVTGSYPKVCGEDGEDPMPQVQIGYRWPLNSSIGITTDPSDSTLWDLTSLHSSSDMEEGGRGQGAHADFMSGWSDAQIEGLMEQCFFSGNPYTGPQKCGAIHGDSDYDGQN
jgi:hypothetical protein